MQYYFPFLISGFLLLISGSFIIKSRNFKIEFKKKQDEIEKKEETMKRRMYELAILKELGERIGYSLNIQQIIDIITGSLRQFIDYSAVSYMILEPEKIIFKVHLEKSVHRKFVNEIKDRMIKSISALLNKDFSKMRIEEILSGAILVEDTEEPMRSFFNIPLVIHEKVVGILTVAHTVEGLYKEEEMTILYKITNQASQAVTKLQEVVLTEQKKLNAMVESMSEGVIMTDMDYKILVVNPAAKKAMKIEHIKDPGIFDLIDSLEGKFDIRGKLKEALNFDKILEPCEILLKDRFYQVFVSPVKTDLYLENKKEILGGVVIFHDITHKKEMDKIRDDFTSMMVHELRTPLDGIKKMSEFMEKSDIHKDEKIFLDYPKLIYGSSSHMLDLVGDLLDIAKIESGKFSVIKEARDIKKTINDRINFFSGAARAVKIILATRFGKLPEKILFDEKRISQVLNNLISNGLKFTKEKGTVEVQAFTHMKEKNILDEAKNENIKLFLDDENESFKDLPDSVFIAITDTGSGIKKENINKLFNKFEQLEILSEDKRGTGLGLIIAKGIVESHNGQIGAVSKYGEGSTFYFTLPIN